MVIILLALVVLIGLLWEPQVEGRNVNADFVTIYFRDPFLAYVYIASIPFFVLLYQAFLLLSYADKNTIFSDIAVKAVQTIKYCSTALVWFILGAEAYFFIIRRSEDDIAGGVAIGLFAIFVSLVIAASAVVIQNILQDALDLKSKNDSSNT